MLKIPYGKTMTYGEIAREIARQRGIAQIFFNKASDIRKVFEEQLKAYGVSRKLLEKVLEVLEK